MEDAWQEAVAAGRYRPEDAAARTAFIAAWDRDHLETAAAAKPAADDWEPVTDPPPRAEGGSPAG